MVNDGGKSYYEIQLEQKQLVVILVLMVAVCILFFFLGVFYIRGRTPAAVTQETETAAPRPTPDNQEVTAPIDTASQADFFEKGGSKEKAPKEEYSGGKVVAEGLPVPPPKPKAQRKPKRGSLKPRITGFVVQIAAVSDVSRANKIRNGLAKQGFRAYIETQDSGDEKLYKVRVGPFKKRKDADSAKADLQQAGHKGVFVSEG